VKRRTVAMLAATSAATRFSANNVRKDAPELVMELVVAVVVGIKLRVALLERLVVARVWADAKVIANTVIAITKKDCTTNTCHCVGGVLQDVAFAHLIKGGCKVLV
jgi:hypothetical protein